MCIVHQRTHFTCPQRGSDIQPTHTQTQLCTIQYRRSNSTSHVPKALFRLTSLAIYPSQTKFVKLKIFRLEGPAKDVDSVCVTWLPFLASHPHIDTQLTLQWNVAKPSFYSSPLVYPLPPAATTPYTLEQHRKKLRAKPSAKINKKQLVLLRVLYLTE